MSERRKTTMVDRGWRMAKSSDRHSLSSIFHPRPLHRRGFTLIEVIATMLLIAIALPAIMKGVAGAASAATGTRRRTEAAGLAEAKLNQLVITNEWQGGLLAGDFSPTYPDYK